MQELITAKEFASRISVSYRKALQLMNSKFFRENRITINTNEADGKKGGKRLNWKRYEQIYL